MKKAFVTAIILGLVVAALGGVPAHAKKKAKPAPVTLYFHGTEQIGEVDLVNNFGAGYFTMDTTEPEAATPRSTNGVFWAGDPQMWNDCAGMAGLPVWKGDVSGKVVGDMKLTLHTLSAPREVQVEVWADVTAQTCRSNDFVEGNYPDPVAETVAEIPAGANAVEVVMKGVKFKAVNSMIVQITPIGPGGPRILYDAADYASSLEFKCLPAKGKSCTP